MSEKELASKMDAALAHVDPDRRKFLGILLAGVAAVPLLNSASLAAEDKPGAQQGKVFPKTETTAKGNTALKDGSANTIKLNDQKTQNIKYWDKTSGDSKAQFLKNNSTIKLNNASAIKGETKPPKSETTAIKGETTAIKGANTANKGETKPVQH
jgi:ferric-dicitrate binding protein FerR (iron transport regulator)